MVMPSTSKNNRGRFMIYGLLLLIVLLAGGALAITAFGGEDTPGEDSAEAGFLRDMSVHHTQAVEMAMIIRDRTDDEQLKSMATDIAFTQTSQIGTMQGFLNVWDLSPTGEQGQMAWMGHEVEGRMPGMASPEEIELLRTLPVAEAETLFLQLMNRHHIAGVDMAQAVIDRSDNDDIIEMAESMIRVQNAEIDIMNIHLEERGAEPVTHENVDELVIDMGAGATPAASPAEDHSGH